MQALKCCILKLQTLWSNNLLFNPDIVIVWVSSTIVHCNTTFTKMIQISFEVMINYIIAVTLHARTNNVMPFCFCSCQLPFSQILSLLSLIYIGLILCSQPLLNSNPLHQRIATSKQDVVTTVAAISVRFAFAPVLFLPWCFSTVFICKCRQTTNVSEMTRILFGLFMFYIWQSWAVLHCKLHCLSRKFTLCMLCGCSCKAFWSATFVMIL